MKPKLAAIAIIGLITLSVFAVGFSALNEAGGASASAAAAQSDAMENGDENAAVSTFKFVCPFH